MQQTAKSKNLVPLRGHCRENDWPTLPQWMHWIYGRKPIAVQCVKKIGGRYMIDLQKFEEYCDKATLDD